MSKRMVKRAEWEAHMELGKKPLTALFLMHYCASLEGYLSNCFQ